MKARTAGFTLLEVLVALVIVAFGMGAVLSALTSAANNTAALHEKSLAEWVGLNQIATVRLALGQPADGDSQGELPYADGKWHWQQTVDDLEIPGIRRITVRVRRVLDSESANSKQATWLATVIGFRGNAVSNANGQLPDWQGGAYGSPTAGGTTGANAGVRNPGTDQPVSGSSSGGGTGNGSGGASGGGSSSSSGGN